MPRDAEDRRHPLLALALGLALAPLCVESAYRLTRTTGLSPTTGPAWVRTDPELGWSYRPGARAVHESAEFSVEVAINAQGFRGPDWPAPTRGRPRVLILGDSYAFGWGLEEERSLRGRLARMEPDWDVLSAAVSGYGTDQQRLLLERVLSSARPDVVVQVFCENDLAECAAPVAYGKRKPWFRLEEDGALALRGVPVEEPWLLRWSLAARAVAKAAWTRAERARRVDREAEWALVLALLRDESRLLGPTPLVLLSERRRLADFARLEPGVRHVDLAPLLRALGPRATFPRDGHWTPEAAERVAERLHQELLAQGLLGDG